MDGRIAADGVNIAYAFKGAVPPWTPLRGSTS